MPTKHSLRPIQAMVSEALVQMLGRLEKYSQTGCPSIAWERLIRALPQVLYSIRSERSLVEQLEYKLLFRWFVGLSVDEPVWDHSTFGKNRDRLIGAAVARELFDAIAEQVRMAGFLSDERFSVDGTMFEAWASHNRLRPRDGLGGRPRIAGRNAVRHFHRESCTKDTHASTTAPEVRRYKKSGGTTAKLTNLLHAVSGSRRSLIVAAQVIQANCTAKRSAAMEMLKYLRAPQHGTSGTDKGHDARCFVGKARTVHVNPQVAKNIERPGGSAINSRATRRTDYTLSVKARKLIEESFRLRTDIGLCGRSKLRDRRNIEAEALRIFTGYNLALMRYVLMARFTWQGTRRSQA